MKKSVVKNLKIFVCQSENTTHKKFKVTNFAKDPEIQEPFKRYWYQ